jgi:hypothetical protein
MTGVDVPLEPDIVEAVERRYGSNVDVSVEDDGRLLRVQGPEGEAFSCIVRRSAEARVEVSLARSGILRSLPAGVAAPEVVVVSLADGEALLLPQPARTLADEPFNLERAERVARALAAVHSTFFGFPARLTASLGLEAPGAWLRDGDVEQRAANSQDALALTLPDVRVAIDRLRQQPAPLVEALRTCPSTIVQGNPAPERLMLDGDAVTFLDWSHALRAPGAVDLGVLLAADWPSLSAHAAAVVEAYRSERDRLGRLPSVGDAWERELALGLLAGLLRYGPRVSADVDFWATARISLDG